MKGIEAGAVLPDILHLSFRTHDPDHIARAPSAEARKGPWNMVFSAF